MSACPRAGRPGAARPLPPAPELRYDSRVPDASAPEARFRRLAWTVLGVCIAVILWGAFVRASGSGAGCGSHWPTCNGEIVHRPKSLATAIELTHRVTSGVSFLLVAWQLFRARRTFPRGHLARRTSAAAMVLMVTEALVGAGLVLFEYVAHDQRLGRAWWMAGHLVNTFLLVAALALTAWWSSARPPAFAPRSRPALAAALGAALAGALLVGVTGAIAALGDTLFPNASLAADFAAGSHPFVRLRTAHPVVALALSGYVLVLASIFGGKPWSPRAQRHARAATLAVLAQIALGFANVALRAPTAVQLVHLLLADVVWIVLVLWTATLLGAPAPAAHPAQAHDAAGAP